MKLVDLIFFYVNSDWLEDQWANLSNIWKCSRVPGTTFHCKVECFSIICVSVLIQNLCRLLNLSYAQQWVESVAQKTDQIKKSVWIWRSKCYFVTLQFPLFHSCTILQIRLPWSRLIHNGALNISFSKMVTNVRKLLAHQRKGQTYDNL